MPQRSEKRRHKIVLASKALRNEQTGLHISLRKSEANIGDGRG